MYNNSFHSNSHVFIDIVKKELPNSILLIGTDIEKYAILFKDALKPVNVIVDGICISDNVNLNNNDTFNNVFDYKLLLDHKNISNYDLIVCIDFIENLSVDFTIALIKNLLSHVKISLLVAAPVESIIKENDKINSQHISIRKYHPLVFKDFDFSYFLNTSATGEYQFYQFFCPKDTSKHVNKLSKKFDLNSISITDKQNKKLHIGYVLPHHILTGGMKALLEQMKQMSARGHFIYAIYQGDAKSALPEWSNLDPKVDIYSEIIVPPNESIIKSIPKLDIIILGFLNEIVHFLNYNLCPIVYWEQGHESLYGEYGQLLDSKNDLLQFYRKVYTVPIYYLSVSEIVSNILKTKYNVDSSILHTGVDTDFYHPSLQKADNNSILLVGNPGLKFKNFEFALRALQLVWEFGLRFSVRWACQIKPGISGISFPIEYIVAPSQEYLANIYREANIFISTSLYESFSLPPLEAMASGVAVVATDCGGIRTYAEEGKNILLCEQGDINSFSAAIIFLLQNKEARETLAANGRLTAEQFSFKKLINNIEKYYYTIIEDFDSTQM